MKVLKRILALLFLISALSISIFPLLIFAALVYVFTGRADGMEKPIIWEFEIANKITD